ncbi:MAG: sugar phosphate isomerase/epimerase [Clostridiaceae bacterium]|jgi:sugar phosphate isomerase/epimerase|nr:sugar phosphate isomerase/epimerase [Clostridiaceae bacterium]
MYFSMDDIGFENIEKIKLMQNESMRWEFIYEIAKGYGFDGIHFTPSLYNEFGLDLHNIPKYFENLKLTLHLGGLYKLTTDKDYEAFDNYLCDSFEIAMKRKMHDISIHPPYVYGISSNERKMCLCFFDKAISKWAKKAIKSNISFTLETHVSGEFFLFSGLEEFIIFADKHPDLGILIDLSHNYFDNYSEEAIIKFLGSRNVKALHISDALQNVDFKKGTHLAVGEGTIDFKRLLMYFSKIPDIFGALEIKAENKKIQSSLNRLKNMF